MRKDLLEEAADVISGLLDVIEECNPDYYYKKDSIANAQDVRDELDNEVEINKKNKGVKSK